MRYKLYGFEGNSEDGIFRKYLYDLLTHRLSSVSPQSNVPVWIDQIQIGTLELVELKTDGLYIEIKTDALPELLYYMVPTLSLTNSGFVYIELKIKEVFNVSGLPVPCVRA